MTTDARTMSPSTVDLYWQAGHQVTVPLSGHPDCRLVFDPSHGCLSLQTPLTGKEPEVSSLRNISFGTTTDGETTWGELRVEAEDSYQAAFAMLTAVADRLQVDGESLALAVPHAVEAYKRMLARRTGLSDEQQRGLVGELLVLQHLISTHGTALAVESWHGPLAEEHDFFFAGQHLEVKTTSGERRRHVIGNTSQLTQSDGTDLWLVSVQITAGVVGAGTSLPALVAATRRAAEDERPEVDRRLASLGWKDTDADLYPAVWQYRTQPRAYLVTGDFPRITDALISDRVPSWPLVADISYRIDLTDHPFPSRPAALAGFVETQEGQA
jgi:hypothetical protein